MTRITKFMPKLKIKSSAKKRFKVTGTGKIKFFSACLRHNTFKRPTKMKRQNRGGQIMSEVNARIVRKYFFHI